MKHGLKENITRMLHWTYTSASFSTPFPPPHPHLLSLNSSITLPSFLPHSFLVLYFYSNIPTYVHTYLHTSVPTNLANVLHAYLPPSLPTYWHTYWLTFLSIYLLTNQPTYLETYLPTSLPISQLYRLGMRPRWRLWLQSRHYDQPADL